MKNWAKVGLGLLAGGLVGAGIAVLGKKKAENDEYYVEVEETETDDSESGDNE